MRKFKNILTVLADTVDLLTVVAKSIDAFT